MPRMLRFLIFLFFLFTSSVWAIDYPPAVFVNDIPGPVVIKSGQEPNIPIFLLMGSLENKEVEFFVWREWGDQDLLPEIISPKEYLYLDGSDLSWKPFETYDELKPFVKAALPMYLRFDWHSSIFLSPFDWETNPPPQDVNLSYNLYICFDDRLDNLPPSEEDLNSIPPHAVCGKAQVVFENTCTPSDIVVDGLTNGALEASFIKGFTPPSFSLELRDNCNQKASCEVKNVPTFLTASMQPGLLNLTVRNNLNANDYSGNVVLSCVLGAESKEISFPVRVQVLEEAPGDCNGILLIKAPSGESIYNGGELSLNIPENQTASLTLSCQRAFFSNPVSDFIAQTSGQCFTVEKQGQDSLVIRPVSNISCSDVLTVASAEAISTITVKLNVGNSCVASKAELSTSNLSFTGSGSKTVYIKDNCGNALSYKVTDVSASWITSPKEGATGEGTIVVSVNTAGLSSGLHSGRITISPQGFDPVTISVTVNVADVQTLSVWPTGASASLEVGESKDFTVTATCSGLPPSQCSVTKLTGEDWFSLSECENGAITVHFDASGLTSGQTYEGSFKVSTSCGSTTVPVELTVTGVCEPSSATLSKTNLSLATQVGSSPSAQTIYVKDNCGKPLDFTVEGVTYAQEDYTNWLSYDISSGSLTLRFDTSSLPVGTYSANLTIKPEGYAELTLTVSLSVEETPPSPPVSAIPLTKGAEYITSFQPQEEKLFSFYSSSTTTYPYLSVMIVTPSSYSLSYLKVILLNAGPECEASPPTKEQIQELIDKYYSGEIPSTTGHIGDLYYDVSDGLVRRFAVFEDLPQTCWYLYIYNDSSTQSYSGIRISYTGP